MKIMETPTIVRAIPIHWRKAMRSPKNITPSAKPKTGMKKLKLLARFKDVFSRMENHIQ
tara:strand:+ start:3954 stop:4130 length:177 start_codon:yes stop_codon:yes gene_type:complete